MSRDGQPAAIVATFPMHAGKAFEWHSHERHQLAWASSGVLRVLTSDASWILPPTRALWIPAGLVHETQAFGPAVMRAVYLRKELCSVDWTQPTPVIARPLLAELIAYLDDPGLSAGKRARAEPLLADLLEPVDISTIQLRMPVDSRALDVAAALVADPADGRTLSQWGRSVGASERTLARAFLGDTGIPFGRWRILLRLQSALPVLAQGGSIASASERAGYRSPSAFVAAFRRETGTTPARYFGSP